MLAARWALVGSGHDPARASPDTRTAAAAPARSRPASSKKRSADSIGQSGENVLVGLDDGDDAAAVLVGDLAVLSTADFFTPVVDDAYDWGRIAAANALSDIYAMGGRPVVAINLVGWPRDVLPLELMTEVLRGGLAVASEAGCPVIGGHSIDDPEPKYGMAVTGVADPNRLLRNDAAAAGPAADPDQTARCRAAQQSAQTDR